MIILDQEQRHATGLVGRGDNMLLKEFFGKPVALGKEEESQEDKDTRNNFDDLFWFIIDHDRLHKDFALPIAKKMHQANKSNKLNKESLVKEFSSMVDKGCMEFYHHHEIKGNPEKIFTKEIKKDLCEKLFDHFYEGVRKKQYELGI